jgi:hypothetical protein
MALRVNKVSLPVAPPKGTVCPEASVLHDGVCGNVATRLIFGAMPKGVGNRVAYPMCAACAEQAITGGKPWVKAGESYKLATVPINPVQAPVKLVTPPVVVAPVKPAVSTKNAKDKKQKTGR